MQDGFAAPPEDVHRIGVRVAQIQTHSLCNGDCIMCPYASTRNAFPQGTMDWDLFTKIIDDLIVYPSLRVLGLTLQNEPLVSRRLVDEIKYVRDKVPDLDVAISTNGSLLDDPTLQELVDAGLSSLAFSINALTRDTFSRTERRLDFDTVVGNLRNLIERKPPGLGIVVKSMLIKDNALELGVPELFSDLAELISSEEIPWDIGPISNRVGSLDGYQGLLLTQDYQSSKGKLYCHDVFENVNVLFNGDVIACCADWSRRSVLGNLRHNSYEEVWCGHEARDRRTKVANWSLWSNATLSRLQSGVEHNHQLD